MTTDELFTYVYSRFTRGWAELSAFREVAEAGLPAAAPKIAQQKKELIGKLASQEGWAKAIKDPTEFHERGGVDGMAIEMTDNAINSARSAVDAASLVFAHSIVDAAAVGFLRVTASASKDDWQQFLCDRKWTVSDVKSATYDQLFLDLLLKELDTIERTFSLPRKAFRLQQLCRPDPHWDLPMKYDAEEVERVDNLRHGIVHGDMLGKPFENIEKDLKLLYDLGTYFFALTHKHYGTKIILEMMFT